MEDMFNREKDGYFHCKTCTKKLFTKIVFEKHLKTEHSTTLKIEKDTEANNNNPIDYQDCKPHISKNQTWNTTDTMDTPSKNALSVPTMQEVFWEQIDSTSSHKWFS